MKRRFWVPLLLLPLLTLLLTLRAVPQSSLTNTAAPTKLTFTALVVDSHGVPIRDLRDDDFALEVAGKTQPVQVQNPRPIADPSSAGTRGLVVVVVDAMHMRWEEVKDVRLNAGNYLAACAKHDFPVSLFLFSRDGVLTPVHEYTTSSATLSAALQQADAEIHHRASTGGAAPEVTAEAQRLLDFYRGQGKFASQSALEEYPGAILGGFKDVAQSVASIPGRKSLIWISSTFPFAVEEKKGKILSPTKTSLAPGDLIYPNLLTPDQVRHLQGIWEESISAAQSAELALYPVQTRATAAIPLNPEVINSMSTLAHLTGGLEVHSVGDFFGQFVDMAEQSRAAYEVVISTDAGAVCKSDWCPMKIAVKRPGARVLAPQGFFRNARAVPQAPIADAQTSGEPSSGPNAIPFTVTWKPAEDAGAKKKIAFVVAFGPAAAIPAAGSTQLNVEVMVHAFADGADKQAVSFGANTELPAAQVDEVRTKGFVLNHAIELEPGDYSVRFVVHDKVSGRLGVLTVPLKVG